jgi:hypothetical protein
MNTNQITLVYPDGTTNYPFGVTNNLTVSFSTADAQGNLGGILSGYNVDHEMGHVLENELMNLTGVNDDCTYPDGKFSHNFNSVEYESCATQEGWADYVGFVSWWNPDDSAARPSVPALDLEDPNPLYANSCTTINQLMEGNVARSFWDLDDAHNEGAGLVDMDGDGLADDPVDGNGDGTADGDVQNLTTIAIANGWQAFPAGTGNHQKQETGTDGVNVQDYDFNAGTANTTLLYHNCIYHQRTD